MVRPGLFISPTQIEMLRISNEGMQAYDDGGLSGGARYIAQDLGEKLITYGSVGSALFLKEHRLNYTGYQAHLVAV